MNLLIRSFVVGATGFIYNGVVLLIIHSIFKRSDMTFQSFTVLIMITIGLLIASAPIGEAIVTMFERLLLKEGESYDD